MDEPPTWLVVLVLVLGIATVGLMEGRDLEEHAVWMQESRESGEWVLW